MFWNLHAKVKMDWINYLETLKGSNMSLCEQINGFLSCVTLRINELCFLFWLIKIIIRQILSFFRSQNYIVIYGCCRSSDHLVANENKNSIMVKSKQKLQTKKQTGGISLSLMLPKRSLRFFLKLKQKMFVLRIRVQIFFPLHKSHPSDYLTIEN